MNDKVYASLVNLCVDICKRNGKTKLLWMANKTTALNYTPKSGEMVLTVHRWFANKSCPGDWLYNKLGDLATEVTNKLAGKTTTSPSSTTTASTTTSSVPYKVKVTISDLNIRKGPGTNYGKNGLIAPGVYTITQESTGKGATKWGKLKSGAGWISLDYATKV
jgi:hypothetical protein